MVASSNRQIKLGTRIQIDGKEYVVEDRTALWVDKKYKHQTFDIFMETGCDMNFGAKTKLVKIYK